jgi:hypothetical protein
MTLAGQQRTIERFFGTLAIETLMQRLADSVAEQAGRRIVLS